MRRIVGLIRFTVGLGALSSFVMSALLFVAAAAQVVFTLLGIWSLGLGSHEATTALTVGAVKQADMVLIAAALLIIGFGLYGLFFGEPADLPEWLEIRTLDDLKNKLVSVVVAVLAVNFFTRVIEWDGGPSILYIGGAVGIVIAALGAYGAFHK